MVRRFVLFSNSSSIWHNIMYRLWQQRLVTYTIIGALILLIAVIIWEKLSGWLRLSTTQFIYLIGHNLLGTHSLFSSPVIPVMYDLLHFTRSWTGLLSSNEDAEPHTTCPRIPNWTMLDMEFRCLKFPSLTFGFPAMSSRLTVNQYHTSFIKDSIIPGLNPFF